MEKKPLKGRYAVLISLILVMTAVLLARLIQWQVVESGYYNTIASTSTTYTVKTDALRGEIFDVNGVELAVNLTGYRVVIDKLYMPDEELNETIVRLVDVLER